jgi:ribosomal protein S1
LAEFSYNNIYQESIRMAPFEEIYGRRCQTPLNWIEPGEKVIFGYDLIIDAKETARRIQANLKAAKWRQESYANKTRQPLEFEVGDHVYLCVSLMKDVKRF